jgi:hypothetical protein
LPGPSHAEFGECTPDHFERKAVGDSGHAKGSPGGRSRRGKTANLNVVGSYGMASAVQGRDTVDGEPVGPETLYIGSHPQEQLTEVANVRLTRGVEHRGGSLGERGGHHDVFGGRHARLVENDFRATEVLSVESVNTAGFDLDTQGAQAKEMRVYSPPPDDITTRGMEDRVTVARGHGTRDENRTPDPATEGGVQGSAPYTGRVEGNPPTALLDRYSHVSQQFEHGGDIPNTRDVGQDHGLVGEQAGSQHGQHGVLVARR